MTSEAKPLKVLYLIARLNIGGPAVQVVSLARELCETRFQAFLACGIPGEGEGDMGYFADANGVSPHYIPELGRKISMFDDFKAWIAILALIHRTAPDIVHTHTAKAGTLGRLAVFVINAFRPGRKKIKVIHTFHGHTFHSYFGSLKTTVFRIIEKVLAAGTDRVVVISPRQKHDICRTYAIAPRSRVRVLPLGFDLDPFARVKKTVAHMAPDSPSAFVVGWVGRLTAVKNPRMLLEAADHIGAMGLKGDNTFTFTVVGDGELRGQLMRETRRMQMVESIQFTGWLKEMPRVYASLDVLLLTSLNEGTPVAIIEAMASGVPVIATDVGGVADLMGKPVKGHEHHRFRVTEYGILVDSGDAEAMAQAVVFVRDHMDDFVRKSRAAQKAVLSRYSIQRAVRDTAALYSSLVNDVHCS